MITKTTMLKIFLRCFLPILILAALVFGIKTVDNRTSIKDNKQPIVVGIINKTEILPEEKSFQPVVLYIPGLFSYDDPQEPVLKSLKRIYRNAMRVEPYIWYMPQNAPIEKTDSKLKWDPRIWEKSVAMAEDTAENLYQDISKKSETERKKLILVGHSLGGRIVIRVLNKLNKKNMKIRQAVLLGAAIENNNSDIPGAVDASIDTVYSFVNPTDKWLPFADENRAMLGTGCYDFLDPKRFCEIQIDSTTSHDSEDYLRKFEFCMSSHNMNQNCIIVPQEKRNIPEWFNKSFIWSVVDQCQVWSLYKDKYDNYVIVDDLSFVRARGTNIIMTESFAKVKKQLQAGVSDGERESKEDFSNISVPVQQDESELPLLTLGSFGSSKELNWRNEQNVNGWRLQNNNVTKKSRILDPSSRIRAQGSKEEMKSVFNKLKLSLPNAK